MWVRLTRDHRAPPRDPLVLRRGDEVQVRPRDDPEALAAVAEWPAFAWVLANGRCGWVPSRFLQLAADGAGVALRDYDTTELNANTGERLEVMENDAESGWLWGRSEDGREGWVPWNSVEPVAG
jgi:Variant SH3 domain